MIRAVLDTNVYVSCLVFGGLPRKVLALLLTGRFDCFASAAIRTELETTLTLKFGWREPEVRFACGPLWSATIFVKPEIVQTAAADPDDNCILECAVAARAQFIVTGDNDLLRLDPFRSPDVDIRIVRPREFLSGPA